MSTQEHGVDAGAATGAVPFASDEWFARARALTADLPARPGLGWRVGFAAGDLRWSQVVEDGRVVAWEQGLVGGTELEVRWPLDHARAVHRGELSGTEALGRIRVGYPDGSEGAPSPLDLGDTEELGALPHLPDATVRVRYRYPEGPFGEVLFWLSYVDGRVDGLGLGSIDEPDVEVVASFSKMVGVRTGAITIIEALEGGGRADGNVGALMLVAGLSESPELQAAERACRGSGPVFARMGQLAATPEHRSAMASLAAVTA